MRLKEWLREWAGAVVVVGAVVICVSAMGICAYVGDKKQEAAKRRVAPPPEVTVSEARMLITKPIWLDEDDRCWHGGRVYLLDVKGHKLAVVISDRGAGICELTREPEAEAKP